ncbi:hypothetical protein EVA_19000, partial [gut metagenome]
VKAVFKILFDSYATPTKKTQPFKG